MKPPKSTMRMPLLGAHMSIAGGFHRAVERAYRYRCDCVQLFSKNNLQWKAKPITKAQASLFQGALKSTGITHPLVHASYLINLAAPEKALWWQSVTALAKEIQRCATLGVKMLVVHPGSFRSGTIAAGIKRIIGALEQIRQRTANCGVLLLLETTAGQGTSVGWQFEQLAEILDGTNDNTWLGVCFDTCHVFAAGYNIASADGYEKTIEQLDKTVGMGRIAAVHLNDSKTPCGSRVDRHEHIGQGQIGRKAFHRLLHDERLKHLPMYIETPKEVRNGQDMDKVNLRLLRQLASSET